MILDSIVVEHRSTVHPFKRFRDVVNGYVNPQNMVNLFKHSIFANTKTPYRSRIDLELTVSTSLRTTA